MTKKLIAGAILSYLSLAQVAFGVTNSTSSSAKPQQIQKEQAMQRKENALALLEEQKAKRQEMQKLREEKVAALKAEHETRREEFQARLLELKDQRKKMLVERIDTKLATINQNWAQRMNSAILRLEALLDKFSERADKLEAEGKDTTGVKSAITAAEAAIQAAKDAVAAQAAKEYAADLSDEESLRNTMGETMSTLRSDLKNVHDVVKTAKQKVIDVARALAKINKGTGGETSTPSVSPTQTSTPSATVVPTI